MPNPNISALYKNLSDAGMNVGTLDQFSGKVGDPSMRYNLWKNLSDSGVNTGSFSDFSSKMGFTPQQLAVNKLQQSADVASSVHKPPTISHAVQKDKISFGDNLKYIWNTIIDGVASPIKGAASVGTQTIASQLSALSYLRNKPQTKKEAQNREEAASELLQSDADKGLSKIQGFLKSSDADVIKHKIDNSNSALEGAVKFVGDIANFTPQLAAATVSPEAALPVFFLSGYQNNMEEGTKMGLSPSVKQSYALVGGGINAALMSIPVGKYLGKVGDKISSNLAANYLSKIIDKYGTDALSEDAVKEAVDNGKRAFNDRIKRAGIQGLKTMAETSVYTFGGAAADLGNKSLVNAETGKRIFDIKKEAPEVFKQAAANTIAFGGISAIKGTFLKSSIDHIKSSIANIDPSNKEQGLTDVFKQIDDAQQEGHLTDEQSSYLKNAASIYSKYNDAIPTDLHSDAKFKIFDLMGQQESALTHINQLQKEMDAADPSFKEDYENQIKTNQAVLQGLHDKIKEVTRGDRYHYFEKDGSYFKQMTNEQPVEIGRDLYDLQTIGQNFHADAERPYAPGSEPQIEKPIKINPVLGINSQEINPDKFYRLVYDQKLQDLPSQIRPYVVDQFERDGKTHSVVTIRGDEAMDASQQTDNTKARGLAARRTAGYKDLKFPIPVENDYGGFPSEPLPEQKISEDNVKVVDNSKINLSGTEFTGRENDLYKSINWNKEGQPISVTLTDSKGQDYTFAGKEGEIVAKNILSFTGKGRPQVIPDEPLRIQQAINRDVVFNYNGEKLNGRLIREGRTVSVDVPSQNRVYEIGPAVEVDKTLLSDHGIELPGTPEKQTQTPLYPGESQDPLAQMGAEQAPPLRLNPDEHDIYIKGIDERISKLEDRKAQYEGKNDAKNAARIQSEIDLNNKYRQLAEKFKVRAEDLISELRDSDMLEINCRIKK